MAAIEVGNMVFLKEGSEGIGAVRELKGDGFSLYVENAGEFFIPRAAVVKVHDGKVLVNPAALDIRLRDAVRHAHDAEDPKLVG
jgi:hypothetical protein